MVFALRRRDAGRLYFADLLGASLGAVAVTFLLSWLGAEQAVLAVSLCPAVASGLLSKRVRVPAAVVAAPPGGRGGDAGAVARLQHPQRALEGQVPAPGAHPEAKIVLTGWNAYSRIDAVSGHANELARLYIDSDAWTGMHRWDGDVESIRSYSTWFRARPFAFTPRRRRSSSGPAAARTSWSPSARAARASPRSR
jgi:hypothetical protein